MNELRLLLAGMRHADQGFDFVQRRGVLADWLEERGDERGARLRDCSWLDFQAAADSVQNDIMRENFTPGLRLAAVSDGTKKKFHDHTVGQLLDLFPEVCICERQVRVEVSKRELALDGGRHHESKIIRWVEDMLTHQGYNRNLPILSWDDNETRRIIIVQHEDDLCPESMAQRAWLKSFDGTMSEWSWPLARQLGRLALL